MKYGGVLSCISHVLWLDVRRQIPSNIGTKGKAVPVQAWTGLEGSRRLRLPDFKTIGI